VILISQRSLKIAAFGGEKELLNARNEFFRKFALQNFLKNLFRAFIPSFFGSEAAVLWFQPNIHITSFYKKQTRFYRTKTVKLKRYLSHFLSHISPPNKWVCLFHPA
jgi:hypothetical protein